MAIGDDGDFRTSGFGHVLRFPPQSQVGGSGSALLPQFTPPGGSTNVQPPFPPFGSFPMPFPFPGMNFPGFPPIISGGFGGPGGGGGPGGTTITVEDLNTPVSYANVDTIQFSGLGLSVAGGGGVVTVDVPGGGAGSNIKYGKITGAAKQTYAIWHYTVQIYSGGSPSGSAVTAYNLYEKENGASTAYGYSVTSGSGYTVIQGTAFSIKPVPTGTWVMLESTSDMPGGTAYWFGAPNRIDGAC